MKLWTPTAVVFLVTVLLGAPVAAQEDPAARCEALSNFGMDAAYVTSTKIVEAAETLPESSNSLAARSTTSFISRDLSR